MEELSQDELWAIYETLPETLKEAIFSEDTADAIMNICRLYDIKEVSKVAKIVGNILSGLLPPQMLNTALVAKIGMDQSTAKKTAMEIEHFILNPLKNDLDKLYEKKETVPKNSSPQNKGKENSAQIKKNDEETKDIYREPIE